MEDEKKNNKRKQDQGLDSRKKSLKDQLIVILVFFMCCSYAQAASTLDLSLIKQDVEPLPVVRVQKPAPPFSADAVVNGKFTTVSLNDYKGKYLVLFFYPLDFTFVCPTEIRAFSDRIAEFKKLKCEVVGVSIDSKYTHLAWINTPRADGGLGEMKIPLLADITHTISRDYGVLLEDGEDAGVALRGLFIINEHGIVRHMSVNDLPVGRSVDEVLRLVQAFQFTDTHDEVCPIGWVPGGDTMKADPEGSKEFFRKHK